MQQFHQGQNEPSLIPVNLLHPFCVPVASCCLANLPGSTFPNQHSVPSDQPHFSGCSSSSLSRPLGMKLNKSSVRSRACGSFFTCTQRFRFSNLCGIFRCSLNSLQLVCLCYNAMPRSGHAAPNSSLMSAVKSGIITLLDCSSLMVLTSVQSIIPPDHSVV